jgi:glycosyl transferase family 25
VVGARARVTAIQPGATAEQRELGRTDRADGSTTVDQRAKRHGDVNMSDVSAGGSAAADIPPIWVISLPSATERRRFVVESFSALNIPFELVDGADGNLLSPEELRSYSRRRALLEIARPLTLGDLGCSLSHLKLYERMVSESVPRAVIMEDDVAPTPELLPVLRELDRVPDGWDVVTLHSLFETADPVPASDDVIAGGFRICRYRRAIFGTQCYVITLDAARRALAAGYPVCMPPDELLFRRFPAGLTVYGIEPHVVHEGSFESELVARSGTPTAATPGFADRITVTIGKARRRVRDRKA